MTIEQISNIQKIFNFILANEMGFDYFERFFILTKDRPPSAEEEILFKKLVHEYEIDINDSYDLSYDDYDEEESYDKDDE